MEFKHIVVVHGIGDQRENETVIGFMNEFIRSMPDEIRDDVNIHNLLGGPLGTPRLGEPAYLTIGKQDKTPDYAIAFSEVFWQPVTNKYLLEHLQPPIPIFTWAHSVNTRLFHGGPRFRTAREAIDNLETMLDLIKRLAVIYKKSGQLAYILERFLGDVEMYVESRDLRDDINQRVMDILERDEAISEEVAWLLTRHNQENCFDRRDIYVVAHSEGTVVAYYSLVQAAAEREQNAARRTWLPRVSGLVTMGSPLDKHYSIWENRFLKSTLKETPEKKIDWYNYWDRSDPVGMTLTVLKTHDTGTDAGKLFNVKFDEGFARYPIPGKAHTDYWTDREIHTDILHKVLGIGGPKTTDVKSKWWGRRWIMEPGDYAAWAVGRLVTVAVLIFFLAKLLAPVRKCLPRIADLVSFLPDLPLLAAFIVAAAALIKFEGYIEDRLRDAPARTTRIVRGILFVVVLLAAGLRIAVFDDPKLRETGFEVKDFIGYLLGLVVTSLVWRLHTVVHKGLVQLWRYNTGWKGNITDVARYRSVTHGTPAAR